MSRYIYFQEIPLTPTEPGLPRPYYTGHAHTEFLVEEAQRAVNEVVYSPDPNPNPTVRGIRPLAGSELPPVDAAGQYSRRTSSQLTRTMGSVAPSSLGSTPEQSIRNSTRYSQSILSPPGGFIGLPEVSEGTIGGPGLSPYIGPDQVPSQPRSPPPRGTGSVVSFSQSNPFASPPPQHLQLIDTDVNEFGVYPSSGGPFSLRSSSLRNLEEQQPVSPVGLGGPRGGRFATVPVKAMGPRAQPGSLPPPSQMLPAMDVRAPSLDIENANDSFSSSVAEALGHDWLASNGSPKPPATSAAHAKAMEAGRGSADYMSPPPQYSVTPEPVLLASSPHGGDIGSGGGVSPSSATVSMTPTVPEENEEEDTSLAYITHDEQASVSSESHGHDGSRRVRFKSALDILEDKQAGTDAQPSGQEPAASEQGREQQEDNGRQSNSTIGSYCQSSSS